MAVGFGGWQLLCGLFVCEVTFKFCCSCQSQEGHPILSSLQS